MPPLNVDPLLRLLCCEYSMQQPGTSTASTSNSAEPYEQQDIHTLQSIVDETELLCHFGQTLDSLGFPRSISATT